MRHYFKLEYWKASSYEANIKKSVYAQEHTSKCSYISHLKVAGFNSIHSIHKNETRLAYY